MYRTWLESMIRFWIRELEETSMVWQYHQEALVRMHTTLSMVEGVCIETGDILDELGQQTDRHKGG